MSYEPIIKTITQVFSYMTQKMPGIKLDNLVTIEDIDFVVNLLNKDLPLPPIIYDVTNNSIIDGVATFTMITFLTLESLEVSYYVNVKTGLISRTRKSEHDLHTSIFYNSMELYNQLKGIDEKSREMIEQVHKKLSFNKVILNELYP